MGDRPKAGVGIVSFKEGRILMHRRHGAHGAGEWSFLGGHMEFGEDPVATAEREAMEEGRITLKNVRPIGFTNDVMGEKQYVTIFVAADWASGEPVLSTEATEMAWCDPKAMPSPLFRPVVNLVSGNIAPDGDVWSRLR